MRLREPSIKRLFWYPDQIPYPDDGKGAAVYQTIHCVSAQLEYLLYLLDGERLRVLPARGILQTVHA